MISNKVKINAVRIILLVLIIFWMTSIFSFSSENGEESSSLSDKITIKVVRIIDRNFDTKTIKQQEGLFSNISLIVRKIGHLVEYTILGFLVGMLGFTFAKIRKIKKLQIFTPTIYSLVYASTDEFHQSFVDGRSPQVLDVGIDTIGGFIGGIAVVILGVIIVKIRRDKTMKDWEKNIRKVTPYVPGEQPVGDNIIKLNTNECPYAPSPKVEQALKDFNEDKLRLYPDPEAKVLVDSIAKYYSINSKQIFVGVGSDDVIGMAFLTFFNSNKPILFPDISYSFYDVWADLFNIKYNAVPLDDNFEININDYMVDNGGVIFPNPNAPTAIALSKGDIEKVIKANENSVVIIDEAYVDFGAETVLDLIEKYENLLVVRTFSKSRAMAGMRIGYAMGSEKLIKAMLDVKYSYNSYTMNMPSIYAGAAAINDNEYFEEIVGKIIKTRETAKQKLTELGFTFTDSKTNFLFASHKEVPAKEIFEKLKEEKIFVRYFNKPRINNYLRITIGTDEEMEALYEALKKIVK